MDENSEKLAGKHVILPDGRHAEFQETTIVLVSGATCAIVLPWMSDQEEYYTLSDLKFVIPDGNGNFSIMSFEETLGKREVEKIVTLAPADKFYVECADLRGYIAHRLGPFIDDKAAGDAISGKWVEDTYFCCLLRVRDNIIHKTAEWVAGVKNRTLIEGGRWEFDQDKWDVPPVQNGSEKGAL